MEPKVPYADCANCPLQSKPFVPSSLPVETEWVCIGEAPGRNEVKHGVPFIGQSGEILRDATNEAGLENVGFTNICLCRPDENADPPQEAIDCCRPRLVNEIKQLPNVKGLITLGRWSAIAMVGELDDGFKITETNGKRFVNPDTGLPTTVVYHPAYLLHGAWGRHNEFKWAIKAAAQQQRKLKVTWDLVNAYTVLEMFDKLDRAPTLVYDIETTSLDNQLGEILEIGFTWDGEHVYIVPFPGITQSEKDDLTTLFSREARCYGHNLKFDNKYLMRNGVIPPAYYRDTMLLHYALDENRGTHGLKLLAQRYLGVPDWERGIDKYIEAAKRIKAKAIDHSKFAPLTPVPGHRNQFEAYGYANIPDDVRRQYLAYDCAYNWHLIPHLELAVANEPKGTELVDNSLMPLSFMTQKMDYTGIRIDRELAEQQSDEIWQEQQQIMVQMQDMVGGTKLNPGSPQQIGHILFDEFKLPIIKRSEKTGQPSTDKDVIAELDLMLLDGGDPVHRQFMDWLLDYRRAGKAVGTYYKKILESLDVNGYSHPDLWVHGTTTGRLTDSLWLVLPRTGTNRFVEKIRYLVLPDPGQVLLHVDYDQAELRTVTVEAQDEIYRQVFLDGGDPHAQTADDIFGPSWRQLPTDQAKEVRTNGKTINFGILYGQGARGMAEKARVPVRVAQAWLDKYWATHRAIDEWATGIRQQVHTTGIIETHFGRKRRYTLIPDDKAAAAMEREAVNMPIQSTAAELLYRSAFEVQDKLGVNLRLMLLNHDAILASCYPELAEDTLAEIVEIMQRVPAEQYTTYVPFTADASYGTSWGACK